MRTRFGLAVSLTIIGCGSSSTSTGGQDIPLEDIPGHFADIVCADLEDCLDEVMLEFFPLDDCVERFTAQFEDSAIPTLETAIERGTVVYHGDRMQDCLDALAALDCDLFDNRLPDVCEDAVEGTVPLGEDCDEDVECEGTAFCEVDAACPGTCSARLGEGDACGDDDDCESGLYCAALDSGDTCQPHAGAGDTCEGGTDPECELGLLCFGQDEEAGTPGTCTESADLMTGGEGDDCNLQDGPLCAEGLSCVVQGIAPPTFSCQPEVGSGEACSTGFPDPCPDGEYCGGTDPFGGDVDGQCEPVPQAGEACGSGFEPVCAPGLLCEGVSEECVEVQRIGGTCSQDEGCYSENCFEGSCAEPEYCAADEP